MRKSLLTLGCLPLLCLALPSNAQLTTSVPGKQPIEKVTETARLSVQEVSNLPSRNVFKESAQGTLPFFCDFAKEDDLDLFTIIDANRDAKKWEWNAQKFVALMYNQYQSANDYLVSPAFTLQKDYVYTMSVDARPYNDSYPEKMEFWVGTAPTAEGLTENILPTTTLTAAKWLPFSATFIAPTDGTYYFAVRGVSDADQYALLLNTFEVSAGVSTLVPATPEMTLTRNPDGEVKATISAVASTTNFKGDAISSLTELNIYRDGEKIVTIWNPVPGKSYEYTDCDPSVAEHTYSVECVNEHGASPAANAICFTGVYYAQAPAKVTPAVGENEGQVVLTWPASDVDQLGNPLRADQVTYDVYRIHNGSVTLHASGLTEPTLVDQVCEPDDEQREVQYTVMPRTSYGQSAGTGSGLFYAGAPYTLPFTESLPGGNIGCLMYTRGLANYAASWDIAKIGSYDLPYPTDGSDNDGGFLYHRAYNAGETAAIGTAKIHIPEDAQSPKLQFDTYLLPDNQNTLTVSVICGGVEETLGVYQMAGAQVWGGIECDLDQYKGKTIQIQWLNTVVSNVVTALDNIRVVDAGVNVGVESVIAGGNQLPIYHNIQGMKMSEKPASGLYIETQDGKSRKVMLK